MVRDSFEASDTGKLYRRMHGFVQMSEITTLSSKLGGTKFRHMYIIFTSTNTEQCN